MSMRTAIVNDELGKSQWTIDSEKSVIRDSPLFPNSDFQIPTSEFRIQKSPLK